MTHALNLVLPLKQDEETRAKLKGLGERFESEIQPAIDVALRHSELVHFARVVVIGTDYICVFTEYEGDHKEYTEFFRRTLEPVFKVIFELAAVQAAVSDPDAFWQAAKRANIQSLGKAVDGSTDMDGNPSGWLFSAYNHRSVKEIKTALAG